MGGKGGLIGAVERAVSEEYYASWPSQPRDHNGLMPASYMLGHHGMKQCALSTEARRWYKADFE